MKADVCNKCTVKLTVDNWWPSAMKRRWLICSTCSTNRLKEYSKANPDKIWNKNCKRLYGIDYNDYNTMLTEQNNSCAICKSTSAGRGHKHFSVDHDHITGKVRGLLCHNCNTGLGQFKDNTQLLTEAVNYLTKGDKVCTQIT